MLRFVFKLEAVLRQRQLVEREQQRELASRHKILTHCHDELRELNDRARATTDDLRKNHLLGKIDLSFLTAHRRYMLAAQRQAIAIAQKIAAAQKLVDEARLGLIQAAKQRQIIEKLKEKQFARWREDAQRREQGAQDEINMQLGFENIMAQRMETGT